ncbi:unnamed protein product [Hyaloperonospora brassicae]|uniref:RxLR effector candidate protein n=1 Tax=Hyaloperonospora brassicae TaxID=162125 RepID=A0AAV0U7Y2_HYABA|nr:unnamed protein product [Hyaloperonospora brassicae]
MAVNDGTRASTSRVVCCTRRHAGGTTGRQLEVVTRSSARDVETLLLDTNVRRPFVPLSATRGEHEVRTGAQLLDKDARRRSRSGRVDAETSHARDENMLRGTVPASRSYVRVDVGRERAEERVAGARIAASCSMAGKWAVGPTPNEVVVVGARSNAATQEHAAA